MYTRLKGIYPKDMGYRSIDIFGYTTQGIPGIEIIGMGTFGKQVKEKFIYISKVSRLEIPFRRYVLCIEASEKILTNDEKKWLELPLLILFLSLSNQIPIKKLEDCFCSGIISATGIIKPLKIKNSSLLQIVNTCPHLKLIGDSGIELPSEMNLLPLQQILGEISSLNISKGA